MKWGHNQGLGAINIAINEAHSKIVTWQRNCFQLPTNATGKEVLAEATRLLTLFNSKTVWEPVAIQLLIIFFPLLLQKPSARSKAKDHTRCLKKRITLWKEGKVNELLSEGSEIQKRLGSSKKKKEANERGFIRLMLEGKVGQALKLVDASNEVSGVHDLSEDILTQLKDKHPVGIEPDPQVLDSREVPRVEEVVFDAIDAETVQKAARKISGSGGPTKVDADTWKHMICAKAFGKLSNEFAEQIALLARRICIEEIPFDYLDMLWACRLVPLIKHETGVRPIGIGETLRRIIGKCVIDVLSNDVQQAAGTLQTCAGVQSGIEAAIHAMSRTFNEEWCEAVILVDAENAFNRLNRKAALHNIQRTCPYLYQFLNNSYKSPSKLHLGDGSFIYSKEGVTQGDPLAMPKYSLSTRGLIDSLKRKVNEVMQVWFADDSSGAGKLRCLKMWWDHLKEVGPDYGYFPEPSKTHLILKNPGLLAEAKELFAGDGVKITTEGHRHVGAALGTEEFKISYVQKKINKWIEDVTMLANIAKDEPQAALSAYNVGLSQRWKFIQRTMGNIGQLFQPLEDAIRSELIPAICGRHVSSLERRIFALPYRYGGLGILNPVECSQIEYETSVEITSNLTDLICQQNMDLSMLDRDAISEKKKEKKLEKEKALKEEATEITLLLDEKAKRLLEAAQEKGASSWLSALPLKKFGYVLNKQEFQDAIHLRYGWSIAGTPKHCGCGKQNSIDHTLICAKGGYVIMRHNDLRDTEAKLLEEVCKDVRTEPRLLPTEAEVKGNSSENARSDITARGVWSPQERTFLTFESLIQIVTQT